MITQKPRSLIPLFIGWASPVVISTLLMRQPDYAFPFTGAMTAIVVFSTMTLVVAFLRRKSPLNGMMSRISMAGTSLASGGRCRSPR
jgi:hypothetical protein